MTASLKKHRRTIAASAIIAVVAALWTWRYVTLNNYYHSLVPADYGRYTEHQIGEAVRVADGLTLRVDSFELADPEDFDRELYEDTFLGKEGIEGKIALVGVTVSNSGEKDADYSLTRPTIYFDDLQVPSEMRMLLRLNTDLGRSTSVTVPAGESLSFTLPFQILKGNIIFGWDRLERLHLYLDLTPHDGVRLQG